ncbi:hypothetical protein NLJ89_g2662 [Agrocybe chaxingu]|uniref:Uncharacterized protein n=1 Tax=Agrocybe chaxingu TaxID=84603 RepID=A0A9W8K735_9AGAR|nr:hypothetical protein NLJ89_g2662 [Agrocybe chaxingu]
MRPLFPAFLTAKDPRVSHGIRDDRLFESNQITAVFYDIRGIAIAEGDILALSIRLASELLLKRYQLPPADDPDSILAKHEKGLYEEHSAMLRTIGKHRSSDFDRYILPECLPFIQAIGQRMAYDAAVRQKLDKAIIGMYVASCVKLDPSWYIEKMSMSRLDIREMEARAIDSMFPSLNDFLDELNVEPYITAPISSEKKWKAFLSSVEPYR